MRIILTAFRGKLASEIMDWPEDTKPTIKMIMDMSSPKLWKAEELEEPTPSLLKTGTFEWKGKEGFDGERPDPIREYVLVDVR